MPEITPPLPETILSRLASTLDALHSCERAQAEGQDRSRWIARHGETLDALDALLPSGSGCDNGSKVDRSRPLSKGLLIETAFHHLSTHGFYTGWTDHKITFHPTLYGGPTIKVSGRDRNEIKDYLGDVFYHTLTSNLPPGFNRALALAWAEEGT